MIPCLVGKSPKGSRQQDGDLSSPQAEPRPDEATCSGVTVGLDLHSCLDAIGEPLQGAQLSDLRPWIRLSQRDNGPIEPESLYEGIPRHLRHQMWSWHSRWLDDEMRDEVQLRFRLEVFQNDDESWEHAFDVVIATTPELYLDVIDLMLRICAQRAENNSDYDPAPDQLELLLSRAGSAWRVASDGRSLQRRVAETAVMASTTAATPGSEAEHHLAAAWQAAYGLDPDASVAYREAVRAVEAVAIPAVEPNNSRATLGTVIRKLRDQAALWELAILGPDRTTADIGPLLSMLQLLWQGQSDRHAPIIPISTDAASMAVHLATALVQWLDSGSVRQRMTA